MMQINPAELPELMTTDDVLGLLDIHEKVLRRLRREGRIKLAKSNALKKREWRNLYAREDVLRLMREAEATQQRAS